MLTLRREIELFFFIIIATSASLFFLVQRNRQYRYVFSPPILAIPSPMPTVMQPSPVITSAMDSPDGTRTLTMKKQSKDDGIIYSFSTSGKDMTEQAIYEKSEDPSRSFSMPYNAWSPDNLYVFLKESTPETANYNVFYASGKWFSDDLPYLNIQKLFSEKFATYVLTDVTGWAAPNLLILNAETPEGKEGPSFWFDVTNRSFIQLSTRFN